MIQPCVSEKKGLDRQTNGQESDPIWVQFFPFEVDLVGNASISLPSYVSLTAPNNVLLLSEDPGEILYPALH
ncbi:hypothetical protein EVAR_2869_1 [Eumeta japonica]|uniref:Uncharacterized protein n=1 Tax=Eumeta variegata TaxID=151549 RepID=A0A4C1T1H1_EUMVA|nr:hypothetical protein EVAR_2869_1 [Eumeta japonica]